MFQNVPQEIFIVSPYKQHLAEYSGEQLLIPTLGKLRQEDHIQRPCLKALVPK